MLKKGTVYLFCCYVISACSVTSVGDKGRIEHHFGYIKVYQPPADNGLTASRITTIGMNLNPGLTLGYRNSELIKNDLRDLSGEPECGLTIIIRDQSDALFLDRVLNQLKGNKICTVQF